MLNIVTSFFIPKFTSNLNADRYEELKMALNKNLESRLIEKVYLYVYR